MIPSLAFLVAAFILAITPGPGLAYVVARTASGGKWEGLASCAGTALGGLIHVVAAAAGLSVLLAQSSIAFTIVKYIGAAYLIFLGIRLMISRQVAGQQAIQSYGVKRALAEGVMVEALNVKTALFFLAFLPQFLASAASTALQLAVMGVICVAFNTLVDIVAVMGTSRLLRAPSSGRDRASVLRKLSGATLIGLGAFVLASKRAA